MNHIKSIYVYIISGIALIISLIGVAYGLTNLLSLTYTETVPESFESYIQGVRGECTQLVNFEETPKKDPNMVAPYARFTLKECTDILADNEAARPMYNSTNDYNKKYESNREVGNAIESIPWILVPLAFFWFIQRTKNKE